MAEADFTELTDNALDESDRSLGVSADVAFAPPVNNKVCGVHVLNPVTGFAGWVIDLATYNPIVNSKGGTVISCMRKYVKNIGYAPMIFFINGKDVASAKGYILGLSEGYPYRITLRKGMLIGGLDEESSDVIRISDAAYDGNIWHNLMLSVTVNTQGDVALRVYEDTTGPPLTPVTPSWALVSGMDDFIDDNLGVTTGELPVLGDFYPGFGHYNRGESGRLSLFDWYRASRHTTP